MYIKTIDFPRSVLNVIAVYRYVTGDVTGNWYSDADARIAEDAKRLGYSREVYYHAVAAFSPGITWEKNVSEVRRMAELIRNNPDWSPTPGDKFMGYFRNVVKAYMILATGDTSYCRGEKVESFARNLLGDEAGVTVDRHAVHIAQFGLWAVDSKSGVKHLARGMYDQYALVYQVAAKLISAADGSRVTGSQVQGVTWQFLAKGGRE